MMTPDNFNRTNVGPLLHFRRHRLDMVRQLSGALDRSMAVCTDAGQARSKELAYGMRGIRFGIYKLIFLTVAFDRVKLICRFAGLRLSYWENAKDRSH